MALIKSVELANGIVADQAYHVVSDVITHKIPSDMPDPSGARPENAPDHVWKKGYYGRVCVKVYYNKAARDAGKSAILNMGVYPTDIPAELQAEVRTESNLICTLDISSSASVIEQAYVYLKTLDYYADALEE
jgi:hypothetical protein